MTWSFSATLVVGRLNSMFVLCIDEPVPRVEYSHIVNVLYVALLEVRGNTKSLAQKVQSVECLGLRLGDGWQVAAAREVSKTDIVASSILEKHSVRGLDVGVGWLVVQQGSAHKSVFIVHSLGEAENGQVVSDS